MQFPVHGIHILNASKGYAALEGRNYVTPDDVKAVAVPILIHRLILGTEAELSQQDSETIIEQILQNTKPPGAETEFTPTATQ